MLRAILSAVVAALSIGTAAPAAPAASSAPPPPPAAQTPQQRAAAFEAGLTRRTGTVPLPGAHVSLDLGQGFYFLDPADARKVLVDAWGNPPDAANKVLGMVFPAGSSPLQKDGWGAVLTYEDTGYVADKDARKTDYGKVLDEMRKHEDEDNRQRQAGHFSTVLLVGWAQPPAYDPARHALIWARDLRFGDATQDTVNYDVRVLGRRGVLSMNMVAPMSALAAVKPAGVALQQVARFDDGSRYADFNAKTDHKAAYGLAGLILAGAGIVAVKKIGLLAVGVLFFKKFLVLILAGFAAIAAWFKRTFGGRGGKGGGQGGGGAPPPAVSGPWSGGGGSGAGGDQIVS